ncbi:hypothetical protein Tco_0413630 [Tanacetum coccineum]
MGSQRKKLSHEGKTTLKENLKEIEAFNSSSVCAAFKRKNARTATRKKKRARCFICKERGHVLWKCHNKKNKNRGETWKPSFDKRLNYPERVHVKTDYMVEGSDKQNWDKIWYVGSAYKNHMSPTKSLFKRLKDNFKMLDIEEDERKFIFSYGVGEASVETKDGALVIPNVYYTPEITMNVLNVEQLENQGYVVTYERNKCGIRYMFDEGKGMIDAQGDNVMVYENSASMIESHNKFLDEYFESIDPKDECSLIKGMEDLKMEKEDVHDYIDDEYLSIFLDDLGGYMMFSLDNKWNEDSKVARLGTRESRSTKRSKQEKPGKEVVGDGSGTAGIKEPQAVAEMDAEIGDSLDGTQGKTAQDNVKVEGNFDWTADNNGEEYTSSNIRCYLIKNLFVKKLKALSASKAKLLMFPAENEARQQYNLPYFFVKRIESARATPKAHLSYGMFLTRLFRYVMEHYPHLDNGIYNVVDHVMRPLTLRQTRRPRSDRGKARHSVSSTFTHHNRGSSSHQGDDDEDDGASRASTPSPATYLNSLKPLNYQRYDIPSPSEQTDDLLFERQPELLNQTQEIHKEVRGGFKSFGKALRGVFRKKKK